MKWESDDGLITVESTSTGMLVAVRGGGTFPLFPHQFANGMAHVFTRWTPDSVDSIVAVFDGDEVIVRQMKLRPFAAGSEADPRCLHAEVTCARVIEVAKA